MTLKFRKEFAKNPTFRTPPMAHQVPIASVRNNVYVLTDGTLSAVFRVHGLEYDLATNRQMVDFCEGLRAVLNSIPAGVQIKVLHRITHNYHDLFEAHEKEMNGTNAAARYVAWDQYRRFYRAMERGELLRSDNLIAVIYNPRVYWWEQPNKFQAFLDSVAALQDRDLILQRTEARFQMALMKFEDIVSQVVTQMRYAGLAPERLDNNRLYALAWEMLNPRESLRRPCPKIQRPHPADPAAGVFASKEARNKAKKNPGITWIAPVSEREQLCASDWYVGDKFVRIDDVYYGAISLRMLPTAVYPSLALALAGIPFEATISIDAIMMEKTKELERQWREARSEEAKTATTLFEATPDPAKQEAASEKRQRYLELTASHQNPFKLRMVITVAAPDERILKQRCDFVLTLLRNMENTQGMRAHYDVDTLIKTTWPFYPVTDINTRKALTSQIANLLPIFSRWEGSRRPVTLLMDPLGRVVKHDPYPINQPNRNKVLCGKSGSGKSFSCQLADVHPHAARENTETLIVESGGSFELTTRCFGGTYIKLGPSSPYHINPFDLPQGFDELPEDKQEEQLRYKYGFIKNLVMAMARITDADSQIVAENVVGTVAQRTYQFTRTPRFRDFYRLLGEYRNPADHKAEELAGRLRTNLSMYVVNENGEAGIYSHYFDTYTNFDVENAIICFDLIDVKNDKALLIPMTLVCIGGLIYNRLLRRDGKERLVIIDEAWALIKQEQGEMSPAGQAIELFWREGRKLGAASVMISQNYSDMTQDRVGRAVVANSLIQYFLVHERLGANDDAFRAANFSAKKMDRVYNLKTEYGAFSEILIKEGDEWGVVRLPSIGIKYWLATTDVHDLKVRARYFEKYRDRYGLDDFVVVAILAEDYPGGVHAPHGKEMTDQEALQFAERWTDHFRRFSEKVARGERIPPDFQ